jgi:hypothetical protein
VASRSKLLSSSDSLTVPSQWIGPGCL